MLARYVARLLFFSALVSLLGTSTYAQGTSAATGQFEQARKSLIRAMEVAPIKFLPELRRRLALYEKKQPFVLESRANNETSSLWR